MAELEILIKNLPKIVYGLKLSLGNSQEIIQQVVLINHAQGQLRHIQQAIAQELSLVTATTVATTTTKSLLLPSIFALEPTLSGDKRLVMEKFGNPEIEISLNTLRLRIDGWMEWGNFLQAIAADILSDAHLVNQINTDTNYSNLATQIENIETNLKINLLFSNPQILRKQIQQIIKIEAEISKFQNRLAYVVDTIKSSQGLLTILLATSSFCGESGFAIEWLDDAHELIISSQGKFQELTDILNDCKIFQNRITLSITQSQNLKQQAEKNLTKQQYKHRQLKKIPENVAQIVSKILVLASSLTVLGLGSWLIKEKITQIQPTIVNLDPETKAVNNLKAALKLGMEASSLAQTPPHPLTVWQQAASKWQEAIHVLELIPPGTSASAKAQERLTRYRRNYIAINEKARSEYQALSNLKAAEKLANEASFFIESSPNSLSVWQQAKDKWLQAIQLLEAIPRKSFVYEQAQATLPKYKTHYTAINAIIQNRVQSVN